jgi:hypothetical protein
MAAPFRTLLSLLVAVLIAAPALASDMIVYKEGVSDEQKSKDEFDCHGFAVKETGFDPMNPPTVQAPESQEVTTGGVGRGAARGAATGAVVGAIAGDAGKGAAAGAAGGAMVGGMRRRDAKSQQAQQQQQSVQQQQAAIDAQRQQYNKAKAVCLEGRGYSVR